ncbi:MAG: lycopene cyclase family protein [Pseudomonadota bacterium]
MSEHVDLAILGGGCAGLSLASALGTQACTKRVMIIEPRRSYQHDRTWCFWADAEHALSGIVSKTWQHWQVSTPDQVIEHTGSQLSYQQIRSDDFYEACLATIADTPNIELRQGLYAESVSDRDDQVMVETDAGPISADFVIDTRPRPPKTDKAAIWQVFSGAEVETQEPCFDPSIAGLMQNMISDDRGLKFTYTLPVSAHRALVQTTRFVLTRCPPERLDEEFRSDLNDIIDGPVTLHRWERGCLPMGQSELPTGASPRIMHAGQAAGALRASSGYGFLRIQAWAEAVARDFVRERKLDAHPSGSRLEKKMDAIFLAALTKSPQAASDWFASLADKLSGDEFGRFMSQSPSLDLWLKVISALPKAPFIRALVAGLPEIERANRRVAI